MDTTGTDVVETDVLIIGAGPVGMTLALTLRKFGANVLIVDKEEHPAHYSRASVVWPRTLEVLDLLGISSHWQQEGIAVNRFTFTLDGATGTLLTSAVASPFPHPIGIGQDRTEVFLDAALQESGADYRRGVDVTDLDIAGPVTATLRFGGQRSRVRAKWVVGCEGSRSLVRQIAGIDATGERNEGVQLLQGDLRFCGSLGMEPDNAYMWGGQENAALLLIPIRKDGYRRILVAVKDDGQKEPPTLKQLQQLVRRFIPDAVLSDPIWLNRFRTQHRLANTYRSGNAFIVGDAAHVWVPIGGQGMNIGIQDAFNLGWKLASVVRGVLPEGVLDTYEQERRPVAAQTVQATELLYRALLAPSSPMENTIRWLIPRLVGLRPVSRRATARLAQIDFRYAPNRLIIAHGDGSGPRAGTRAPDGWVARVSTGESLRLFDLYRTGRWQIFGWVLDSADAPTVASTISLSVPHTDTYLIDATKNGIASQQKIPVMRDRLRSVTRSWGVTRSGIHVVRPDGVIAYRGPAKVNLPQVLKGWFTTSEAL